MIYLYLAQDRIESHTDKDFAENVLKLGKPLATITEQEWSENDGLARMIDGVLVLGKTDAEIADYIYAEVETTQKEKNEVLSRASLKAELLNRDQAGEFVARVKPVDPVVPA